MPLLRFPRRRRNRVALIVVGALALYLVALSAIPALRGGGDDTAERRERARRTIASESWGLVMPDDRAALARAVDDAWRGLRGYRFRYVTGLPEDLAAGRSETEATSSFVLDELGRIAAQRDTNFISSASPGSGGREERFEGFRIRSDRPFRDNTGRKIDDAEFVYTRTVPGDWTCERIIADRVPPPAPGLDFATAGDAGFSEIDGYRVRGFIVAMGVFGLRAPSTVWIDTDTLLVRRQEIDSVLRGRREVWTYGSFDVPVSIVPPGGVLCRDS